MMKIQCDVYRGLSTSIDGSFQIVKEQETQKSKWRQNRFGRSFRLHLLSVVFGGADRARTGDLLVANQALSQLSYSP
jgi:hypothetical protein